MTCTVQFSQMYLEPQLAWTALLLRLLLLRSRRRRCRWAGREDRLVEILHLWGEHELSVPRKEEAEAVESLLANLLVSRLSGRSRLGHLLVANT